MQSSRFISEFASQPPVAASWNAEQSIAEGSAIAASAGGGCRRGPRSPTLIAHTAISITAVQTHKRDSIMALW